MKSSALKISVVLLASVPLLVYVWNPFGAPNWNPLGRLTGKQYFKTPGQGMRPTYPSGTSVLVCFDAFKNQRPRVNDIVVFRVPNNDETADLKRLAAAVGSKVQINVPKNNDILYLKRVAAVAGSIIEIRDSRLLVDEHVVTGPFWWAGEYSSPYSTTLAPTLVPTDSFFALGDNIEESIDSRRIGPVPFSNVVGGLCARQ